MALERELAADPKNINADLNADSRIGELPPEVLLPGCASACGCSPLHRSCRRRC